MINKRRQNKRKTNAHDVISTGRERGEANERQRESGLHQYKHLHVFL